MVYWTTTKLASGLSGFSKFIEYIISKIFWPTTKMALAVPDSSKFDWVHFWLDFFMVRPTTKLGFGLSDVSINDEVHFLARGYDSLKNDGVHLLTWFFGRTKQM